MRKTHKKSKCENGHLQQDVYKENVRNISGRIIAQRFRCRTCRQTLDVDHTENLIGNPFDIVERRDEEKDRWVLDEISRALPGLFLINFKVDRIPYISLDEM
jgi:hypothetical protein